MSGKKRALVSVYDKTGISEAVETLISQGYHIVSTGGTYTHLKTECSNTDHIESVVSLTQFPEILGGRVKTLHPKLYGGILSQRSDKDSSELQENNCCDIDIVIVNLYPFSDQPEIENIDIGGVSLLRASAKNYKHVISVCDPKDYHLLKNVSTISGDTRHCLAQKTFSLVEKYDKDIRVWFAPGFPLKYGLNPHQAYAEILQPVANTTTGQRPLTFLNGTPGYINMLDALAAWQLVREACVSLDGKEVVTSFKHTSPAGVGTSIPLTLQERKAWMVSSEEEISELACAYIRARNCDPLSSFGDFVACSHVVDVSTATQMKREVCDGVIAPGYTPGAYDILRKKKGGRFIILKMDSSYTPPRNCVESRQVFGFELIQDRNAREITRKMFSRYDVSDQAKNDLVLGNIVLKYTQSNSIVLVYNGQAIGVGAGQQNRLECVKIATRKALVWFMRQAPSIIEQIQGCRRDMKRQEIINYIYDLLESRSSSLNIPGVVMCSDAFFPFQDNIDYLTKHGHSGVTVICQPGGSVSDDRVELACKKSGRTMIKTGIRLFTH